MHEKKMDLEKKGKNKPDWAERLQKARASKKISQRGLVEKIGVNQTTLVFYERGKREPRIGFLMDLVRATDVDGHWLLTGKGDMYGEEKTKITKEDAIAFLFDDKSDSLLLYLLEALKDPFLKAIMYTKILDYKLSQEK